MDGFWLAGFNFNPIIFFGGQKFENPRNFFSRVTKKSGTSLFPLGFPMKSQDTFVTTHTCVCGRGTPVYLWESSLHNTYLCVPLIYYIYFLFVSWLRTHDTLSE